MCVTIFIDVVFRSCSLDTGDGSVTTATLQMAAGRGRLSGAAGVTGLARRGLRTLMPSAFAKRFLDGRFFFSRGYSAWLCWPLTQFKVDVGELTSNKVLHRVSPVNLY